MATISQSSRLQSASVESEAELYRRMPEIRDGLTGTVKDEVTRVFIDNVPDYFWIARSSSSHHPRDERGLGGLWLHTKRVMTTYKLLEPTHRALQTIDDYQANCLRAAVLLHDAFKYGIDDFESEENGYHEYARGVLDHLPEYTDTAHDVLMASFIRDETQLPDEVARAVEAHGGSNSWYGHDGRSPENDQELLVHTADVVASNDEFGVPVYEPCVELKRLVGQDIDAIEADNWL